MTDKQQRRTKMKSDFTDLFNAAEEEIKEFADKAAAHAKEAFDGLNANPRVKRAKRRAKETLARLGASLLKKFGNQAERDALERSRRKRTKKPSSKPPTPPPAAPKA